MDGDKARGSLGAQVSRSFQSGRWSKRLLAEAYERLVPVVRRAMQVPAPAVGIRQRREVAS